MKKEKTIQLATLENTAINLNDFFGQSTLDKAGELYEQLERPILNGKQTGIESRNLTHWVNVLNDNPTKVWGKKFTFVDFIWIKIVEQLRGVNVGFELIKNFKSYLFEPIKVKGLLTSMQQAKNYIVENLPKDQQQKLLELLSTPETKTEVNFTMLHIIIIDSILNKLPLSVAIFSDGSYQIVDKSKEHLYSKDEQNKLLFDTYITVSISSILKTFLRSELSGFVVPKLGLLSYAENKLFEVVHSGDYESILINFKDKKIKTLELKKSEDIKQRIIDILDKGAYGEIVVKKHKGVVTKIENTIRITL